jgi:hydrogenase nickel incorporation protein HypB
MVKKIPVEKKVLSENDRIAGDIRSRLKDLGLLSLNLVSSPGSGKTTLLEKTLEALSEKLKMVLIAGDVQTDNDAARLVKAGGTDVHPIMTRGACHLDANMVNKVLVETSLDGADLLIIENVGNLVCPSSYDLGEDGKVVFVSVTEGDDKPLKYPGMFRRSSLMIVSKLDLLPHCQFDVATVIENARTINNDIEVIQLSSLTGDGMEEWYRWLKQNIQDKKQAAKR